MRQRNSVRLAFGASVSLVAGSLAIVAGTMAPAQAADPVKINLVGINDFHGRIDANTVKWAGTVKKVQYDTGVAPANSLIVGAGDLIGASVFASASANDQPTIEVMNEIELDASAVGNHEFDKGWADLRDRVIGPAATPNAQWDYLGANVYQKGTTTPVLPEYFPQTIDGVRVAVIGAVTQETPSLVSPGGITDLDFGDPIAAVNRVAASSATATTPTARPTSWWRRSTRAPTSPRATPRRWPRAASSRRWRPSTRTSTRSSTATPTRRTSSTSRSPVATCRPVRWCRPAPTATNVGQIVLTYGKATGKVTDGHGEQHPRVTTSDADLIANPNYGPRSSR